MKICEKAYWVAVNSVPGIGPARFAKLLDFFGSAEEIWTAPIEQLELTRLERRTRSNLTRARSEFDPATNWSRLQRSGIDCLTWNDDGYPTSLRTVDGAPPVLYVRGTLLHQDSLAVALVGTRQASAYGREVAHHLASALARNGVTVVSGLALGIDTIAHQAAIDAGGRTIAVLGSGVDHVYPYQNRKLADMITQRGAVVSEYRLGTRPDAANFPPRNRIISGLSQAVIIVEAGNRSGALITATFAAEQGRDVYAVPGSILHPGNVGCNRLIQEGATPLLSVDDVLEQLAFNTMREKVAVRQTVSADPAEQEILTQLSNVPLHIDELARNTTLPAAQIGGLLTVMELKGLVRQVGTLQYVYA